MDIDPCMSRVFGTCKIAYSDANQPAIPIHSSR